MICHPDQPLRFLHSLLRFPRLPSLDARGFDPRWSHLRNKYLILSPLASYSFSRRTAKEDLDADIQSDTAVTIAVVMELFWVDGIELC